MMSKLIFQKMKTYKITSGKNSFVATYIDTESRKQRETRDINLTKQDCLHTFQINVLGQKKVMRVFDADIDSGFYNIDEII